uniref:Protein AAR2 homolog n=1 Tax=Acrobeloides nanus TaxID=290746 RepID=A0A914DPQ5_9BILA
MALDTNMQSFLAKGEMSQELARELFERGGFIVFKNFEEGMEFGIDYKSWNVAPKFIGLKMIPPGVHFIYISVKDAPRIGFFHNFKEHEILVRTWSKENEDFIDDVSDSVEIQRIRANLKNLDRNLGPYPYENYRSWISLSNRISEKTIKRLQPKNKLGRITGQSEVITKEEEEAKQSSDPSKMFVVDRTKQTRVRYVDTFGLPIMNVKPGFEINFSEVPQITLADTNLKRAGIDSSERLYKLLASLDNDINEFLGEFQYAFVVFLMGQVYEGFEQWKRLIHLLCSCTSALVSRASLFKELLMILLFQLKECPDDFFHDVLAKDNFLVSTLSLLFANVEDTSGVDSELLTKSRKFKAYLSKKFGVGFDLPED